MFKKISRKSGEHIFKITTKTGYDFKCHYISAKDVVTACHIVLNNINYRGRICCVKVQEKNGQYKLIFDLLKSDTTIERMMNGFVEE